MSSTWNIIGSVKRSVLALTLLGSLAVGVSAAVPAAYAYTIPPLIGVNAYTLAVTGHGFTRGGTVELYVQDADTGMWFDANGATSTAQVLNGYARAGSYSIAALCGRYPHQHRCYRPNAFAGAFTYTPHISVPTCDWADDSLVVSAYDTRSGQWASATVDYSYAGTCDSSDSQDTPSPPDSGD